MNEYEQTVVEALAKKIEEGAQNGLYSLPDQPGDGERVELVSWKYERLVKALEDIKTVARGLTSYVKMHQENNNLREENYSVGYELKQKTEEAEELQSKVDDLEITVKEFRGASESVD